MSLYCVNRLAKYIITEQNLNQTDGFYSGWKPADLPDKPPEVSMA